MKTSEAEDARDAIARAVRAPSSHNSQPWRFALLEDGIALFADPSRKLSVVDPGSRELVMSCGALLDHLVLLLERRGYAVRVAGPAADEPATLAGTLALATLELRRDPTQGAHNHALADAINARHTHRADFQVRVLPEALLQTLTATAEAHGAELHAISDAQSLATLAELVALGNRAQLASAPFRRELAAWMRPHSSIRPDGLRGDALGMGALQARLAPLVLRMFDLGARQAKSDARLLEHAPALFVLATDRDDLPSWLSAGRALSRVLLSAAVEGVQAGYFNQPVQVANLRPRLRALCNGGHPQLVLRMGYAEPARRSQRRGLDAILR